jgi:hypothetical protein
MNLRPTRVDPASASRDILLGALGAIIGAGVGYLLFLVLSRQGLYAIVLPGALTGLGCGSLSGRRSIPLGIGCAVLGVAAGIVAEWQFAPFIRDRSFLFFVTHLHQIRTVSQVLILLGGILAFWFGLGRTGGAWLRKRLVSPE